MKAAWLLLGLFLVFSSARAQDTVLDRAKEAVQALKDKNLVLLSRMVHPSKGIVFSSSVCMDANAKTLTRQQVQALSFVDPSQFQTVVNNCSAEPMDFTFSEFYKRFIYDVDYSTTGRIFVDDDFEHGECPNNVDEVYPDADIVEFLYPSSDQEEAYGVPWKALFLVFEKGDDEQYYLVAIAHGEASC